MALRVSLQTEAKICTLSSLQCGFEGKAVQPSRATVPVSLSSKWSPCGQSATLQQTNLRAGLRRQAPHLPARPQDSLRVRAEAGGSESKGSVAAETSSTESKETPSAASASSASGYLTDDGVKDRFALLDLYLSGSDDDGEGSSYSSYASGSQAEEQEGAGLTVGERLRQQAKVVVSEEVVIPIGPKRKLVRRNVKAITESDRRNIRRAEYLEEVGNRNDSGFYAVVAGSVLLPPIIILGYAYASGYLEFLI